MRMAFSNLALYGGAFFTPVIVGITTDRLGWEWSFWLVVIFSGLLFPFLVFFVPETAYRRPAYLNLDITSKEDLTFIHAAEDASQGTSRDKYDNNDTPPVPQKDSFFKTILPINGRKTDDTFWKILLRPLPLLLHPAILWGMVTQGTLIGWTVMIGVDIAFLYSCEFLNICRSTHFDFYMEYSATRTFYPGTNRLYLCCGFFWWPCWVRFIGVFVRLVCQILDKA